MSEALLVLAVLACPVGMWFIMRGNKHGLPSAPDSSPSTELTELRGEVDQLQANERESGQEPPTLLSTSTGSR